MFRNGFEVTVQPFGNLIEGYAFILRDQYQYLKPSVVRKTLEVPFKLLWGLHRLQYSDILKNVGISVKVNLLCFLGKLSLGMLKDRVLHRMARKPKIREFIY